ncbi:MAG: polysaccharide deacetylase [Ruminococcus sp.]|nr:polysaccharide deacetylase [Ruminococcus sp.]
MSLPLHNPAAEGEANPIFCGDGQEHMYFGSVKFFKHLIYTVFFTWIAAATFLAVFFGFKYFSEKKNAEAVAASSFPGQIVIPDGASVEQIFLVMATKRYSSEDMLDVIKSGDEEIFAEYVKDYIAENPDIFADGENALSGSGTPFASSDEPYMELYPELYADNPPTAFKEDSGTIYLTFDDGPSDRTSDILEILDRYDIKATFFVCGGNDEKEQELMRQIAEAGHTIGIHSISHDYEKIYASVESYLDDFYETYMSVYNATGIRPQIFRFPGGSINNYNRFTYMQIIAEMTRRGFVYYDWNVSGEDAVKGANWTSIYNNIMSGIQRNTADRSIVLLHDSQSKENTVYVLEDVIDELLADGYKFDKLDNTVNPATFTYRD